MKALQAAAVARAEAVYTASRVHEPGAVPTTPPTPYLIVSVDGGRDETQMLNPEAASDAHRLVAQGIGASMDELTFAIDKARAAFSGYRLAVAGYDTTPCEAETSGPVIRDTDASGNLTGFLSMTLTFTLNAFPESDEES